MTRNREANHRLSRTKYFQRGFGTLGQSMAQLGRAIGMEVLVAERKDASVVRADRVSFTDVSRQAMQTLADQLVDNLEAFVRGEPKNLI